MGGLGIIIQTGAPNRDGGGEYEGSGGETREETSAAGPFCIRDHRVRCVVGSEGKLLPSV